MRHAIAAQRKRHYGIDYNPDTEVLVTVGATEAIAASVLGLVEPGSEVLVIEPFYDSYSPVIAMAGCVRTAVPLVADGAGFRIDTDGLRAGRHAQDTRADPQLPAQSDRRRGLRCRVQRAVAALAIEHDLLVITDEVYEQLVFGGPAPAAGRLPRHGRVHRDHLQRGRDVQRHRLEDRVGLWPCRTHRRGTRRLAVPQL